VEDSWYISPLVAAKFFMLCQIGRTLLEVALKIIKYPLVGLKKIKLIIIIVLVIGIDENLWLGTYLGIKAAY
jgi:hypothetical protein